ncbi:AGE family epimerase/isomerase [Neiella marina]|uniref:AGE family epimerase/isomerase n=1 Tax=Neiella holothuriorum TaxID=2870530 RepID=A0ABS7EIE3_9GAMM|nr:AGE family epimerase/isomerase [Neiella holothuriorum]MBW8192117.1 AGE family epimerase/isomerase [Neiella holothuriorum]
MMTPDHFKTALLEEMRVCILPFWMYKASDQQHGGYWGSIKNNGFVDKQADKGGILHARLLWAFSKAYQTFGHQSYADHASRTWWFMRNQLTDETNLELYWSSLQGKHFANHEDWLITQAYYLFALSAFGHIDPAAKSHCQVVFKHLLPAIHESSSQPGDVAELWRGYLHLLEALDSYLQLYPADTQANVAMTHLLERAAGLLDELTAEDIEQLNWGRVGATSWLLQEFAERYASDDLRPVLVNLSQELQGRVQQQMIMTPAQGIALNLADENRYGWVQAEALASAWFDWQAAPCEKKWQGLIGHWQFIFQHISDRQYGEWKLQADGETAPNLSDSSNLEKVGFWKCPYHNFRACLTVYNALSKSNKQEQ